MPLPWNALLSWVMLFQALGPEERPFATQRRLQAAQDARRAGQEDVARRWLVEALEKDPENVRVLSRLLQLDRSAGRAEDAALWARRMLALGVDPGAPLDETSSRQARALQRAQGRAEVAAVLPMGGVLIEGIAAHSNTGDLWLAAVNQGCILRRDARGRVTVWARMPHGAPLALAVDERRGWLWAAGGTAEPWEGYDPKGPRYGVLVAFDLVTRRVVHEQRLEGNAQHARVLGDILLHPDGTIFVSDGGEGGVWAWHPKQSTWKPFIPEGRLRSPQGMAWLPSGEMLIADYALGLFRVSPSGECHAMESPQGLCLLGLDGLIAWKGAFVATQNGVSPARVWRLKFVDGRLSAESWVRAHPAFGDPTLMTVHRGALLLVANAPWERFGPGGKAEGVADPIILLRLR